MTPLAAFGRFHRDARLFLLTTALAGGALSLYWIDFNLYLRSLGYPPATIGLVATVGSLAGALSAFPASALSDRVGRRSVMAGGIGLALLAAIGLALTDALPAIVALAALWSIGQQSLLVVQAPFLTERSEAAHRNELFALQSAVQTLSNVTAAVLGGVVATTVAAALGLDAGGPGVYRIILVIMALLLVAAAASIGLLGDDRPGGRRETARLRALGEPAAFPLERPRTRARFGLAVVDRGRFVRLLLPGFLIAVGAGQVIPFLNVYVQGRFGLDLASLNALFAFTSLGTVAATLAQPRLARRFGQITSVVIVQGASLPFLAVLGFSPILWTVIVAMAVRNSLMNAGNPIFSAFAMEHVAPVERATLAAAMSVLWQLGWVIGGSWYALLQATLGFDAGYTVNFVTVIVLYATASVLYWTWFADADRRALAARRAAPGG